MVRANFDICSRWLHTSSPPSNCCFQTGSGSAENITQLTQSKALSRGSRCRFSLLVFLPSRFVRACSPAFANDFYPPSRFLLGPLVGFRVRQVDNPPPALSQSYYDRLLPRRCTRSYMIYVQSDSISIFVSVMPSSPENQTFEQVLAREPRIVGSEAQGTGWDGTAYYATTVDVHCAGYAGAGSVNRSNTTARDASDSDRLYA
ncbi:hypothetical protein GGS23DRAFT_120369 [Durotheca rogersii]|uniref:uncharacterized protein n=1 Tax=Durotheca rogersii TaxID=419775 RepID=UPI00221EE264|nr:uncharacterized protein GGS23DRAFT_120369 [Durotheca rogersii]KAI5861946.1 hypothetical protein GGS23DRAFT_120369 [Durotheca rogersii]